MAEEGFEPNHCPEVAVGEQWAILGIKEETFLLSNPALLGDSISFP